MSTSRRLRVYISGPITLGDQEQNVQDGKDVAEHLFDYGFAPLCPHLSWHFDWKDNLEHEDWMEMDLPWVAVADAVYRIPGKSRGADEEVAYADELGIPVFYDYAELHRWKLEQDSLSNSQASQRTMGDPRFHAILKEAGELHDQKQQDYGTVGDPFANVRASAEFGVSPWKQCAIYCRNKLKRISAFCQNGRLANEGLRDAFLDCLNYAGIGLVLLDEEHEKKGSDNGNGRDTVGEGAWGAGNLGADSPLPVQELHTECVGACGKAA